MSKAPKTNAPQSLKRSISPPPITMRRKVSLGASANIPQHRSDVQNGQSSISELAAVEAGKATVDDHLAYFSYHLSQVAKPIELQPLSQLSISKYAELYQRNTHIHGHHFVIHQHNHPIAGCHYDLRLQFSESSACSFAVPYGLPGNPNSRRQGRMAIETRVHTLWNNLIESASHATGSLLIWDTGEYEILPRKTSGKKVTITDDELSGPEYTAMDRRHELRHENEKLIDAFKTRYIRLRLHGSRLPKNYTVILRLPSANDVARYSKSMHRGKRKQPRTATDMDDTDPEEQDLDVLVNDEVAQASEEDNEAEDTTIRANNAYTGAENTIGSVHQRHWFITLDKSNSGFVREGGEWIQASPDLGFEPFFVRGADVETSIVTGRTSVEVMADEGVEGFAPRKMWKPVLE